MPEVGGVSDAINQVADEVNNALANAKSPEKIAAIMNQFDQFQEMTPLLLQE